MIWRQTTYQSITSDSEPMEIVLCCLFSPSPPYKSRHRRGITWFPVQSSHLRVILAPDLFPHLLRLLHTLFLLVVLPRPPILCIDFLHALCIAFWNHVSLSHICCPSGELRGGRVSSLIPLSHTHREWGGRFGRILTATHFRNSSFSISKHPLGVYVG